MGEKLQFYFDIDELLLDQKLPRLSLQPFLENCIRHGYGGRTDQVLSIEVKGLREGDQCVFQITDDGIGSVSYTHLDVYKRQPSKLV